jgi:D-amino-acid oxidase
MAKKQVLIVGAGVVGLTTAVELKSKYGDLVDVTIISKDLPGDISTFYTSPKAGAHWISTNSKENKDWHLTTYKKLQELSKIPETFIEPYQLYMGEIVPNGEKIPEYDEPWFKDQVEDFKYLGNDPKFPDVENLYTFTSYTISTTYYLVYLLGQARKLDIHIQRYTLKSLKEAESFIIPSSNSNADLVINCTGLQYNFLNDSNDSKLIPVRGHVILIENNLPYQVTFEQPYLPKDAKQGEFLMLFPRPEGGAILGGIYDHNFNKYDTSIDQDYVTRLINKAKKYIPDLVSETNGNIKISNHVIGFRPERVGGAKIGPDANNKKIIHNYGNGNSGFIESWGCAENTVKIIVETLFGNSKL